MTWLEGLFWGMTFSSTTSARNVVLLLAKSCVLLVFCVVSTNLLTMAAAGAIQHRHLPDGGIQWLPVKPWTWVRVKTRHRKWLIYQYIASLTTPTKCSGKLVRCFSSVWYVIPLLLSGANMSTGPLFHDEMSETTSVGVSLLLYRSECLPNGGV
jgi:hypothetical protein